MRNVLVTANPFDPATNSNRTVRIASAWADSTLTYHNSQLWLPALTAAPKRSIVYFSEGAPAPVSISHGILELRLTAELGNTDWSTLDWNGAQTTVSVQNDSGGYDLIFTGQCGTLERDGIKAAVPLLGPEAALDTNLLVNEYAGTGGAEGDEGLEGNLKPLAFGKLLNIEPVLIDQAFQVYQFHDGAAQSIEGVYENAYPVAASPTSTVTTYAQLISLSLDVGDWAACPSKGLFRLGGEPLGKITSDVTGAGGTTIGSIVPDILARSGIAAQDIDSAGIGAWTQQWALYLTDQVSVGETARAAFDGLGFLMPDAAGVFRATNFWADETATELREDRSSLPLVNSVKQLAASRPAYNVKVGHSRNWTVQSSNEISEAVKLAGLSAEAAQTAAESAQATADAATARLVSIAADAVLDRSEKYVLIREVLRIEVEQGDIDAKADVFGLSRVAYDAAITSLTSYLDGLSPAWNNTAQDTNISGAVLQNRFVAVYDQRQLLLNAIAVKAGSQAVWGQVSGTGKPADNATVGAKAGLNLNFESGELATDVLLKNSAQKWSQVGNDNGNRPADGATKNRVYRQATAPSSPINGDSWTDTSVNPNIYKLRIGGAWVNGANFLTNTSELIDGAGFATTANWSGVSSPPDNLGALTGIEPIQNTLFQLLANGAIQTGAAGKPTQYFSVGNSLVPNPQMDVDDFNVPVGWGNTNQFVLAGSGTEFNYFKINSNAFVSSAITFSNRLSVSAGERFYVSLKARSSTARAIRVIARFYPATGNFTNDIVNWTTSGNGQFEKLEGFVTAPADAATMILFVSSTNASVSEPVDFYDLYLGRTEKNATFGARAGSTLYRSNGTQASDVDITAPSLSSTGQLTIGNINYGSVTGAGLGIGTLGYLSSLNMDSGLLTDGSIYRRFQTTEFNKLNGVEALADISAFVDGSLNASFQHSSSGTAQSGEFPRGLTYRFSYQNGSYQSAGVTWTYRVASGSVNGFSASTTYRAMSGSGIGTLNITSLGSDSSQVIVRGVYAGKTQERTVVLTKAYAPPETSGGSSSATQTSGFTSFNSGTWTTVAGALSVTTSGTTLTSTVNLKALPPTGAGSWTIEAKVQRKISGTWTDSGAVVSDGALTEDDPDIGLIRVSARFQFSRTATVATGSAQETRVQMRISAGANGTFTIAGTSFQLSS